MWTRLTSLRPPSPAAPASQKDTHPPPHLPLASQKHVFQLLIRDPLGPIPQPAVRARSHSNLQGFCWSQLLGLSSLKA